MDSFNIRKKLVTIFQLIPPFASPQIYAVAGSVSAKFQSLNRHVRRLDVMLVFGCDFVRRRRNGTAMFYALPEP